MAILMIIVFSLNMFLYFNTFGLAPPTLCAHKSVRAQVRARTSPSAFAGGSLYLFEDTDKFTDVCRKFC